jgi:hypothetical protein
MASGKHPLEKTPPGEKARSKRRPAGLRVLTTGSANHMPLWGAATTGNSCSLRVGLNRSFRVARGFQRNRVIQAGIAGVGSSGPLPHRGVVTKRRGAGEGQAAGSGHPRRKLTPDEEISLMALLTCRSHGSYFLAARPPALAPGNPNRTLSAAPAALIGAALD